MIRKNMKCEDKYEFTNTELRQLQLKSLEMAVYFRDFCVANGLRFYMCGGCCIGAVRHGGFIPWDDDVDFFMPREDYEKLGRLWNEKADTSRYSYCRPDGEHHYRNLFATINDNNTTFIKKHQVDLDINHGVVLDILPLDGYPDSDFARRCQVFWALIYSIFCAQMVPENHGRFVALLGRILLALVPFGHLRCRIWQFAQRQMAKYKIDDCQNITELCSGLRYMRKKYPKRIFDEGQKLSFEGEWMPVPRDYDLYLKTAFGDYMTLPDEKDRVAHHDVVFCDLYCSYKKYKGKYYCKENDR